MRGRDFFGKFLKFPASHLIMYWKLAGLMTAIKILLLPTYHSTDFEVHRNWLAITYSLPAQDWYHEATSEWTLDYPPFFAWFECALARVAQFWDNGMLELTNLNYASDATVLFQRLSVIVTDFVFLSAIKEYCQMSVSRPSKLGSPFTSPKFTLAVLLMANFGLLLVDHIHFQYNGFLFGILLYSINAMCQGRHIASAFWFAVLMNFKHIFLYMAPAYFVFLLRNYCFSSNKDGRIRWLSFSPVRFLGLGIVVASVFAASFGPFIAMGQLEQVLSRLFPFRRGLCHAYWAPNIWALYNVADKGATILGVRLGFLSVDSLEQASMTGGLVQEFNHAVLPSVKPVVTLVLTVISILPSLLHTWLYPGGARSFLRCVVLCAYGAYMFGWHVHEKAVLMMIIPLTLLALEKKKDAQVFLMLSTVGHFSLFPLIFTQPELPVKYILFLIYTILAFITLGRVYEDSGCVHRLPLLTTVETVYLLGLVPLELYCAAGHSYLGLTDRLPFLPLIMTSVYSAVGVTYSWIKFYGVCLSDRTIPKVKSN